MIRKEDSLEYHSSTPAGKLSVAPVKACQTQRELRLTYTPGAGFPCREIGRDPSLAYKYTAKGNLVAVISNGSAVLGLGNVGPLAGKPMMEGKAVLFKRFADIDAFDIELNTTDPKEIIRVCQLLEPTFGGIDLEDIQAPDCFEIEEALKRTLKIPVFHDGQHGTAIISGAALLNAVELVRKRLDSVRVVFCGAGAGALACAAHYVRLGVRPENILMCDSRGVIHCGRLEGMNPYKQRFARNTHLRTLAEAVKGADVFVGLSTANVLTSGMLRSMAHNPIVFAMANPEPEIAYDLAKSTRPDVVLATGRFEYPNQISNSLGFPFIFRAALDVRATAINDEMKVAATHAVAALAKEEIPDSVRQAYGIEHLEFGREYLIPKPLDSRILVWETAAVARAAMDSGAAQELLNLDEYRERLERRLGKAYEIMRLMIHKAQRRPMRVVFPEGEEPKILRACQILLDEKIAWPILIGNRETIQKRIEELRLHLDETQIVDPSAFPRLPEYADELHRIRHRKGITRKVARELIVKPNYFGSMMVRMGDADALIGGRTQHYPETIKPALAVIEVRKGLHKVSGVYLLISPKRQIYFLADCTVNIEPTDADLAEIALCTAEMARRFDVEPRVAMLSFSNFGSSEHPLSAKVRRAVQLVRARNPKLIVDGEMQADTAVVPELIRDTFPFSALQGGANVLIFPCLEAGNIAYKLLSHLGGAEVIGPILMGLSRPVHVLQRGAEVTEIVNMTAVAVVDAQEALGRRPKPQAARAASAGKRG